MKKEISLKKDRFMEKKTCLQFIIIMITKEGLQILYDIMKKPEDCSQTTFSSIIRKGFLP